MIEFLVVCLLFLGGGVFGSWFYFRFCADRVDDLWCWIEAKWRNRR